MGSNERSCSGRGRANADSAPVGADDAKDTTRTSRGSAARTIARLQHGTEVVYSCSCNRVAAWSRAVAPRMRSALSRPTLDERLNAMGFWWCHARSARPRPRRSFRVCLALLCIMRSAAGGCRGPTAPAARSSLTRIETPRRTVSAGGGALPPARPGAAGAAPARRPSELLRLRGAGILKKLAKGLPMNLEERKYWDMAKRGELHRLLQIDNGKKSRRDLAILRKKSRVHSLALPPAAQERLAAQIADKARSNPLLADKSSAVARFSARSLQSARKGGRPDVWQDKTSRTRKEALPKSDQVATIRDSRPGLSAN